MLRELGYRSNTKNDIRYEVNLRYPKDFLGLKKDTDPPLRGKADYVCKAGGRVAWVIEAKSSEADITADAVQQAYTYACHPEIRSVYFCLSTDSQFRVYATDATPEQAFLFSVDPRDTQQAAKALQPQLGPRLLGGASAICLDPAPLGAPWVDTRGSRLFLDFVVDRPDVADRFSDARHGGVWRSNIACSLKIRRPWWSPISALRVSPSFNSGEGDSREIER